MKKKVILRTEAQVVLASQYLAQALDDEQLHEVAIRPFKSKRSLDQNDYYWKLISDIADYMGEEGAKGREYVSLLMKQEFLEPTSRTELPNGDIYVTFPSTADMTMKQLSEFSEMVERWAVTTLGFVRNV